MWSEAASYLIKAQARRLWGFSDLKAFIGQPMALYLVFYRDTWHGKTKSKRNLYVRPDLSNFIKVAEDAIMGALGLDDSAIVELTCSKVEREGEDSVGICLEFIE